MLPSTQRNTRKNMGNWGEGRGGKRANNIFAGFNALFDFSQSHKISGNISGYRHNRIVK